MERSRFRPAASAAGPTIHNNSQVYFHNLCELYWRIVNASLLKIFESFLILYLNYSHRILCY